MNPVTLVWWQKNQGTGYTDNQTIQVEAVSSLNKIPTEKLEEIAQRRLNQPVSLPVMPDLDTDMDLDNTNGGK